MDIREQINDYCRLNGFQLKDDGMGRFGAASYWAFYRRDVFGHVVCSIEYICLLNKVEVSSTDLKFCIEMKSLQDFISIAKNFDNTKR